MLVCLSSGTRWNNVRKNTILGHLVNHIDVIVISGHQIPYHSENLTPIPKTAMPLSRWISSRHICKSVYLFVFAHFDPSYFREALIKLTSTGRERICFEKIRCSAADDLFRFSLNIINDQNSD